MSKIQSKEIITTPTTRIATTYIQPSPLLKGEENKTLDRKITLAVDGFMTGFCEKTLRDRNKLSANNALTIAEYIIAMKREINPRLSYVKNTIQILSEFSRYMKKGRSKRFQGTIISLIWIASASQKVKIHCINGLALIILSVKQLSGSLNGCITPM